MAQNHTFNDATKYINVPVIRQIIGEHYPAIRKEALTIPNLNRIKTDFGEASLRSAIILLSSLLLAHTYEKANKGLFLTDYIASAIPLLSRQKYAWINRLKRYTDIAIKNNKLTNYFRWDSKDKVIKGIQVDRILTPDELILFNHYTAIKITKIALHILNALLVTDLVIYKAVRKKNVYRNTLYLTEKIFTTITNGTKLKYFRHNKEPILHNTPTNYKGNKVINNNHTTLLVSRRGKPLDVYKDCHIRIINKTQRQPLYVCPTMTKYVSKLISDRRVDILVTNDYATLDVKVSKDTVKHKIIDNLNALTMCKVNTITKSAQYLLKNNKGVGYYPYKYDWTGRIYSAGSTLSPQGNHISKGLLQGDKDIELTPTGYKVFMDYGRKLIDPSLTEKDFIIKYYSLIESIVSNKGTDITNLVSTEYLATYKWCVEYMKYCKTGKVNILIPIDGSCSVLQHIAALIGSKELAYTCGLLGDKDFYTQMSNLVKDYTGLTLTRDTIKLFAIPLIYGSSNIGLYPIFKQHILKGDGNLFRLNKDKYFNQVNDIRKAFSKLASVRYLLDIKLRKLMDNGGYLKWVTGNGFMVENKYPLNKITKVNVLGIVKSVAIYTEIQDKLNKGKMKGAILPNFIHSLDAYHIQSVIDKLPDDILFYPLHDSMIIRPNDVNEVQDIVDNTFKAMYNDNTILQDNFGVDITDNKDMTDKDYKDIEKVFSL